MTSPIDLIAPATITVLPGAQLSSLQALPPGAISIADPFGLAISVTLVAQNTGAAFSASATGGATVASAGNMLVVTGLQAQVNAALASLEVTEFAGAPNDIITLTATDTAGLAATTQIAVDVAAATGPAFAAPPASLTLQPYSLTGLAGLVLGDPAATGLAAAGLGAQEVMQITLAAASGILLLPGLSAFGGIAAEGVGTGQIILTFTADDLPAVNTLLAGLEFAAPAATSGLAYSMRDVSGPLGGASTNGNITLNITGTPGQAGTLAAGADTLLLGAASLAAGTRLAISGELASLGGIAGGAAVTIAADGALTAPYNTIALGGTSFDFGTLIAGGLSETGALLIADGATIGGLFSLGAAGLVDFAGNLLAAANAPSFGAPGFVLGAGALITGSGTLLAGNFSQSGNIAGGTILAAGGETILIAAGSLAATQIDIAAGGVVVLGPVSPLYGVFDATPLTIAPTVTIAFQGQSGAATLAGGYADTLAESGGVAVISSPDVFAAAITGFAPGDRLIFPGLTGLSLQTSSSHSFVVAGVDNDTVAVAYTFAATLPAGASLFTGTDANGDGEIGLRDTGIDVFVNGASANSAVITAKPGVFQPILGAEVLPRSWTTQTLVLTVSVARGILSDLTVPPVESLSSLAFTAASPTALQLDLASLAYTGNAGAGSDALTFTGAGALLTGLSATVPIALSTAGGTVSGFGDAGQVAAFAGKLGGPLTAAAAPGAVLVTGTAEFADVLDASGLSGTALLVDAGGVAMFDAGANISFGAAVIVGDAGGAGQIDVLTPHFFAGANVTLGGNAAAAGAAEIAGNVVIAGTLLAGLAAAASIAVQGTLGAAFGTIGAFGTLAETGSAAAGFQGLTDAGMVSLFDDASAQVSTLNISGTLDLGGTSSFGVQLGMAASGAITIGPEAFLSAQSLTQPAGAVAVAGTLSLASALTAGGALALAGGTIIAPDITLQQGATLGGFGFVEGAAGLGTIFAAGAEIFANGGPLQIGDDISLSAAAAIAIGPSAALDVVHGLAGGTVTFGGANAELTINDLPEFGAAVTNMLNRDVIDLVGVAPSLVSFAAGSISAGTLGGFSLAVAGGQLAVQLAADGAGGTLITLGGELACFARGTRLLTPNGYRPVETFAPGDPVITQDDARRAVRWIGRRTLDLGREPGGDPVRFAAGALGPGIPARPVLLSPLHAVFCAGVLVPARHLVNGATIVTVRRSAVTYFHLELDRHDILLAEGMPAESYLDTGNRGSLYHEQGVRGSPGPACAPLVTAGPKLAAIRRQLHQVALAAGYTLTYAPALRGAAGGVSVMPALRRRGPRRLAAFKLPAGAAALKLAARSAAPAETDPESEDRRQLGICVAGISAGALGAGWLAPASGDAGVWMGGAGEILLAPGLTDLTLSLAAVVRSWAPPRLDFSGQPS